MTTPEPLRQGLRDQIAEALRARFELAPKRPTWPRASSGEPGDASRYLVGVLV